MQNDEADLAELAAKWLPELYAQLMSVKSAATNAVLISELAGVMAANALQSTLRDSAVILWCDAFKKADQDACICLFYVLHDMIAHRMKSNVLNEQIDYLTFLYVLMPELGNSIASLRSRRYYICLDKVMRCLSLWKQKLLIEAPFIYHLEKCLIGKPAVQEASILALREIIQAEFTHYSNYEEFRLNSIHRSLQESSRKLSQSSKSEILAPMLNKNNNLAWLGALAAYAPLLAHEMVDDKVNVKFLSESGTLANVSFIRDPESLFKVMGLDPPPADTILDQDEKYILWMKDAGVDLTTSAVLVDKRFQHLSRTKERQKGSIVESIEKKVLDARNQFESISSQIQAACHQRCFELGYRILMVSSVEDSLIGDSG